MSLLTKLPRQLYDPEAFDGFLADRDFRRQTAKAMAWLSQLAYETDEPEKIKNVLSNWQLRLVDDVISEKVSTVLPIARTCAFAAAGRGATFIAFAGTDPLVLANWISDLDIDLASSGTTEGFTDAASIAWKPLDRVVRARSDAEKALFVTGHSLGAALAIVTALRLTSNPVTGVDAVYAFGTPRPGNGDFARRYNASLGTTTYRLVHGDDIVATVAPSELGFRHVGRYLHCGPQGKFDSRELTADARTDDPLFDKAAAEGIKSFLHSPFAVSGSALALLRSLVDRTGGRAPPEGRTDLAGVLIELLPPQLRDHGIHRYCNALA